MANIYPSSPTTSSTDRFDLSITGPDVSFEPSFHSPAQKESDLIGQMMGGNNRIFRTPRGARNPPQRNEFTPLLQSTSRHHFQQPTAAAPQSQSRLKYVTTASPIESREPTGSLVDLERVLPPTDPNSSSMLSFRDSISRDRNAVLRGGNTLSLKEQEAKIDSVTKENFNLKLKIHFLNLNLEQHSDEHQRQVIQSNVSLNIENKTQKVELQRLGKDYKRSLKANTVLQQERDKLSYDLRKTVKGAVGNAQLEQLQKVIDDQEDQIRVLTEEVESARNNQEEDVHLQIEIEQLQLQVREHETAADSQEKTIQDLEFQLRQAQQAQDDLEAREEGALEDNDQLKVRLNTQKQRVAELEEEVDALLQEKLQLEQEIVQQEEDAEQTVPRSYVDKMNDQHAAAEKRRLDQIASIKSELSNSLTLRDAEIAELQAEVDSLRQGKETETAGTRGMLERLRQSKESDIATLRAQLESVTMVKETEVETMRNQLEELQDARERETSALQAQIESLQHGTGSQTEGWKDKLDRLRQSKDFEISTLQRRLQEALSSGGSHAEIAERLAEDAEQRLQTISAEKDQEVATLEEQLCDMMEQGKSQLRSAQKTIREKQDEIRQVRAELQAEIASLESDLQSVRQKDRQQKQITDGVEERFKQISLNKDAELERLRLERAGELNGLTVENDEMKGKIGNLERDLESLRRRGKVNDEVVQELREVCARKDQEASRLRLQTQESTSAATQTQHLRTVLEEKQVECLSLKEKIDRLEIDAMVNSSRLAELDDFQRRLEDRDREIQSLHRTLNERTEELDVLRVAARAEERSQIDALNKILAQRNEDIDLLRQEALTNEKTIEDLARSMEDEQDRFQGEIEMLEGALDSMEGDQVEMQDRIEELEGLLSAHELSDRDNMSRLEQNVRDLVRERDGFKADLSILQEQLTAAISDKATLRSTVSTLQSDVARLQDKLTTASAAVSAAAAAAATPTVSTPSPSPSKTAAAVQAKLMPKLKAALTELSVLKLEQSSLKDEIVELKGAHQAAIKAKEMAAKRHVDQLGMLEAEIVAKDDEIAMVVRQARAKISSSRKAARREDSYTNTQTQTQTQTQTGVITTTATTTATQNGTQSGNAQRLDSLAEAATRAQALIDSQKRHALEIRGLMNHIMYLRALAAKKERFRNGLVFEKQYMIMQIEMYTACNHEDLRLIEQIGLRGLTSSESNSRAIAGGRSRGRTRMTGGGGNTAGVGSSSFAPAKDSRSNLPPTKSRVSLRAVGIAIVALIRLGKWKDDWTKSRKIGDALAKKLAERRKMKAIPASRMENSTPVGNRSRPMMARR